MKALIVEDEEKARKLLRILLQENCPEITEISEAKDLPEGVKLIHSFKPDLVFLDIELKDGSNNQLLGFYTINEDKLDTLLPESITRLHQAGFLQAIYMVIASQAHINDLVARKNDLLSV
mgnify:CR=1 FL=1